MATIPELTIPELKEQYEGLDRQLPAKERGGHRSTACFLPSSTTTPARMPKW